MKNKLADDLKIVMGVVLVILISSCEHLYDKVTTKHEEYIYQVNNTTPFELQVAYALAGNNIIGNKNLSETIKPGEIKKIWLETGEKDRMVSNYQRVNTSLTVFTSLKISQKGNDMTGNLLAPARWQYKEENWYKATYTLSVSQNDFNP